LTTYPQPNIKFFIQNFDRKTVVANLHPGLTDICLSKPLASPFRRGSRGPSKPGAGTGVPGNCPKWSSDTPDLPMMVLADLHPELTDIYLSKPLASPFEVAQEALRSQVSLSVIFCFDKSNSVLSLLRYLEKSIILVSIILSSPRRI
jgi:hypothetical protein